MKTEVTQASCADSGTSKVKFHVVEYRQGLWWAVCGTGNDGSTMLSTNPIPAHTVPKQGRCGKSLCQRRFFGADEDALGVAVPDGKAKTGKTPMVDVGASR
jgi:hypothetical protein